MKKWHHIIILACLVLAMGIPLGIISEAAPSQGDTHIFILGAHHTWSNNGDAGPFDRSAPGTTPPELPFKFNLAELAGVHPSELNESNIQVRPYVGNNPEWSDWTSRNFRYNATRAMGTNSSMHKDMFEVLYGQYTTPIEFVRTGGKDFHYNPTTGELTFRMKYSLNTLMGIYSYPMHEDLIRDGEAGLQDILAMIGDDQPPDVMSRLQAGVNHGNPNLRGYLYFMPFVITYNTAPEQDMGMVDVTLQNSTGQSVSYLRPGEGHTVTFFTRHVTGDIPVGLDPVNNPLTTIDVTITDGKNQVIHRQTHQARDVLQPGGTIGVDVFPV